MSPTGESSVEMTTGGKCLKEQQLPNSDGWMLAHFQPFPPSCLTVLLTKKSRNARCGLFTFPTADNDHVRGSQSALSLIY